MGKNKLAKFADMDTIDFVLQYPFAVLEKEGFPYRGKWHYDFFHNNNPIVVELGCGKGEYTVDLAQQFPDQNFIGIDIKGARMWSGASKARALGLKNVAFLRTSIELLDRFFAPEEISEIWITFPDPQMKKQRKRLTSSRFLALYNKVLMPGGVINLKTDSPFLYNYTGQLCQANSHGITIVHNIPDVYARDKGILPYLDIKTHYEKQWLQRGLTIKYIAFKLTDDAESITDIDDTDIQRDTYRSYSRGTLESEGLRT